MTTKKETRLLERIQRMDGNIKNLRGVIKEQKSEIKELKASEKRLYKAAKESIDSAHRAAALVEQVMRLNDNMAKKLKIPKLPDTIH